MFILVDNKDRENEGDLVIPASKINPKTRLERECSKIAKRSKKETDLKRKSDGFILGILVLFEFRHFQMLSRPGIKKHKKRS